jgi:hypothetical protein
MNKVLTSALCPGSSRGQPRGARGGVPASHPTRRATDRSAARTPCLFGRQGTPAPSHTSALIDEATEIALLMYTSRIHERDVPPIIEAAEIGSLMLTPRQQERSVPPPASEFHPRALDLVDAAMQRPHGGDHKSAEAKIKASIARLDPKPAANTRQQALRRLRKDRPDLHRRVLAEETTPHAAMIEAGFRHRTITVPVDDATRAARAARRTMARDRLHRRRAHRQ